ncbi:WAT1-related protein [Drosera capensis]
MDIRPVTTETKTLSGHPTSEKGLRKALPLTLGYVIKEICQYSFSGSSGNEILCPLLKSQACLTAQVGPRIKSSVWLQLCRKDTDFEQRKAGWSGSRMEKLVWRRLSSQAKVLGTAVSIMGALIVILYKGPAIILVSSKSTISFHGFLYTSQIQWIIGGSLLASEYILTPVWYIVQAQIIRQYPAELVVVFFYNLFVALMSAIVGSVAEPDPSKWRLKPDISMAAIVYGGLVGSFLGNSVHAWVMRRKGPVYVAMFKPVSIVVAAAMGVIFLGDTLHLGSIVGATVIILGFYAVMWGKAKDEICEELPAPNDVESSAHKTPLLHSADVKQVDGDERFV